jgi:hypothetical protein
MEATAAVVWTMPIVIAEQSSQTSAELEGEAAMKSMEATAAVVWTEEIVMAEHSGQTAAEAESEAYMASMEAAAAQPADIVARGGHRG